MSKKVISCILVISIILSFCSLVSAKVQNAADDEIIGFFTQIGLINVTEGVEVDYSQKITRAEVAELWADFFQLPKSDKMYYYDVPTDYWAFGKISALTERNIITGGSGKKFRPDDLITLEEACVISIKAIGLEYMVNATGKSYLNVANDNDLLKGISVSENLTKKDAYKLIYNTIIAPMSDIKAIKKDAVYYQEGDETLLSTYRNIYVEQGVVTGVNMVDLYSTMFMNDGYIRIDDREYKYSGASEYDLLGQEVSFYYKSKSKNDDDCEIIYIYNLNRSKCITAEITEENSYDAVSGKFSYYDENDRKRTANITPNASLIYNGEFTDTNISEVLNGKDYFLKLVEVDNAYDLIIVEKYYNLVAERVDTVNKTVYDKINRSRNKCLDERNYEKISFYTSDGMPASFSDINAGAVLSILESKSGNTVAVYISQNVQTGRLDSISSRDEQYVYEIDGKEYYSDEDLRNYSGFATGNNVQVYTDYKGKAVYISSELESLFGYITKIAHDERGLNDTVYAKIFDNSGAIVKYSLSEKVKIDGVRYKEADKAYMALGGEAFKPCLAAFNVNSNSEITMLDLPQKDDGSPKTSENMLVQVNDFSSYHYDYFLNKFGPKVRLSADTVVIGVPTKSATKDNDRYYTIGKRDSWGNDEVHTGAAFMYGTQEKEYADIVLVYDEIVGKSNWISTRFVVDEVAKTLNEDDEVVDCIYGYHGNNYKQIFCSSDFSCDEKNIGRGTVLNVSLLGEDIGPSTVIVYNPHDENPAKIISKDLGQLARDTMGYVNDIVGTTVKVGFENGAEVDEVFSPGTANILIYDSEENELSVGSLAEIRTYKQYDDGCDLIYIYTNTWEMRNFIIFR